MASNDLPRKAAAAALDPDASAGRLPPLIELAAAVAPDDEARLRALIETAAENHVAALGLPVEVLAAARKLPDGESLRLATVLDPEGDGDLADLLAAVAAASRAGADEITLGLPLADVLDGDHGVVHERVQAAREAAGEAPRGAAGQVQIGLLLVARRLPSPVDLTAAARGAIMGGAAYLVTDLGLDPSELAAIATVLAVLEEADGRVGLKVPAGRYLERTGASLLHLTDHFFGPRFATPAKLRLVLQS